MGSSESPSKLMRENFEGRRVGEGGLGVVRLDAVECVSPLWDIGRDVRLSRVFAFDSISWICLSICFWRASYWDRRDSYEAQSLRMSCMSCCDWGVFKVLLSLFACWRRAMVSMGTRSWNCGDDEGERSSLIGVRSSLVEGSRWKLSS